MPLLFLDHWIPDAVMKALCWTFVHSLWLGTVAALAAGIIIHSTRKARPQLRYNLLVALFGFFILVTAGVFLNQLSYFHSVTQTAEPVVPFTGNIIFFPYTDAGAAVPSSSDGMLNRFVDFFNEHASTVVMLWALFFTVRCLQVVSGLCYVQRLRKRQVSPAPANWAVRTTELARALGIYHPVQLLQSARLDVPVTIGWIKASILVPLGLLANLPPDQVEAVLLHELAHIRRRDYLVNLLQRFAETIFFFNPAVLWISSLIRQEREACCDDMVLAHLPGKKVYLEALVAFQEYALIRSGHAMALLPHKNYLLHRIRRMLTQENQKLNTMEKIVLLSGVVLVSAFGLISKAQDTVPVKASAPVAVVAETPVSKPVKAVGVRFPQKETPATVKPQSVRKAIKDTVPEKDAVPPVKGFSSVNTRSNDNGNTKTWEMDATDHEGKKYHIKKENNTVTEFTVDGKAVPKEQYAPLIDQIERVQAEGTARRKAESQKRKMEMEARKVEARARKKEYEQKRVAMKEMQKEKREQKEQEKKQLRFKYEQDKKILFQKKQLLNDSMRKIELRHRDRAVAAAKASRSTNGEVNGIIGELMARDIISNTESLSFSLNSSELVVNSVKQPASVHQALKEKYLDKPGDQYSYSKNGGTTTITINKE